jgi:Predicted AAA-ATPase/PD-(D/E)XK nuclease superfamily
MLDRFLRLGTLPEDFATFHISKAKEFVEEHCGKYPVIRLDFRGCRGSTWDQMFRQIWMAIRYMLYLNSEDLNKPRSDLFDHKLFIPTVPPDNVSVALAEGSLGGLVSALYEIHHQKPVIILIDEYDTPFNEAFNNGFFKEAAHFFNAFYTTGFKSEGYKIAKVCMMGILEINGLGIFSNLNNMKFCSMDKPYFWNSFGLLPDEIRIVARSSPNFNINRAIEWYNGYMCGGSKEFKIINTYSFMQYLTAPEPEAFWVETGNVRSIDLLINPKMKADLIVKVGLIMGQGRVEVSKIAKGVDYTEKSFSSDKVLHLLVHTGYLTYEADDGHYYVSIPNKELMTHWETHFHDLVMNFLDSSQNTSQIGIKFQSYLSEFDLDGITDIMSEVLVAASYHDLTCEKDYQNLFFAFFLGILHGSNFRVSSNKECGLGRYDIKIKNRFENLTIVFELKHAKSDKIDLEDLAEYGFQQIYKNQYITPQERLQKYLLIGEAFYHKTMSALHCKFNKRNEN